MNEAIAVGIFAVTLVSIFLEKWHRVVVSALGASAMVLAGHIWGFFNEETAIEAVEFETIALLLSMMIIISLFRRTGFFEYLAIKVAQYSGGSLVRLMLMLGVTTSLLSMFLDNVTTIVLMSPMIVLIAELMGVSPIPLLISQAIFSNIGGMATLVGDPPNILIGSASHLTFSDFLVKMGPITLAVWAAAYLVFRYLFRGYRVSAGGENRHALTHLSAPEALTDPTNALRLFIVLTGVIALFFVENTLHLAPAFAAFTGAAIALAWTQFDIHETLADIEWDVLLFFTALFVLVGGLEGAGVLEKITEIIFEFQDTSPVLLGLIILWAMVILSALVDNIPITIAVIPIILSLGARGMNTTPLWWAIALGAGLGGNATPIGSTANVLVISLSERTEHPITTRQWLVHGVPVVVASTVVASILYVVLFDFLST